MAIITKEEIKKIAAISNIILHEHEIEPLQEQLTQVLAYAQRVVDVSGDAQDIGIVPINVTRPDVPNPFDAERILAQAPEREGDYFVVPIIIEQQ